MATRLELSVKIWNSYGLRNGSSAGTKPRYGCPGWVASASALHKARSTGCLLLLPRQIRCLELVSSCCESAAIRVVAAAGAPQEGTWLTSVAWSPSVVVRRVTHACVRQQQGVCGVCRVEPATRQCDYCIWDEHEENVRVDPYKGYGLYPPPDDVRYRPKEYCFACFALEHRKSREVRPCHAIPCPRPQFPWPGF